MKIILLEDVKSLGKKGDCQCQRRLCQKHDSSQKTWGRGYREKPE